MAAGSWDRVNLIGIWVSTRDLREVGWTVSKGAPSAEFIVEGGDEVSLLKVDGVVLDSGSKVKPVAENCILGEKVAFPGESPFMVIWLKVSSNPEDGECLFQGDWPWFGSIALRGEASLDPGKKN